MELQARRFCQLAAAMLALATIVGALGTHALRPRLTPDHYEVLQTALHYQYFHSLGLLGLGLVFDRVPWPRPDLLHKARRVRFGGKNYDDAVARARIAQAFGRLIRRDDDKGVFVILDPAAPTRLFSSLPPGVSLQRVGLVEAIEATAAFLGK